MNRKEATKKYLAVRMINSVVSSFKVGVLGSTLVFVFVDNAPAILVTANMSIATVGDMIHSILTKRYVGKISRMPTFAYVTAHVGSVLDLAFLIALYLYRDAASVVMIYFALLIIVRTPQIAFGSSLMNTLLGGNKHLSKYRVRYMSQTNIWSRASMFLGGGINIAIYHFFGKVEAIDICLLIFTVLIFLDGLVDVAEHIIVKKTRMYRVNM